MARDHTSTSVKSELPEGMKKPAAPGEQHMGGVKKGGMGHTDMGSAVKHLEKETERGGHCPKFAGHSMKQHSGHMDE